MILGRTFYTQNAKIYFPMVEMVISFPRIAPNKTGKPTSLNHDF